MGSRRRYLGTSRIFNVTESNEFVNGFDVEVDDDGVEATISSAIEPERKVPFSAQGAEGRSLKRLLATMEREAYRARRQAGEFAVPKIQRSRNKPATVTCEGCGGARWVQDGEGNWRECPACRP